MKAKTAAEIRQGILDAKKEIIKSCEFPTPGSDRKIRLKQSPHDRAFLHTFRKLVPLLDTYGYSALVSDTQIYYWKR